MNRLQLIDARHVLRPKQLRGKDKPAKTRSKSKIDLFSIFMPKIKQASNGFTTKQVADCTGLSVHMVNHLARHEYLLPHYDRKASSGSARYYSYRDVIVGRLIARLLDTGVSLKRLKTALHLFHRTEFWERLGREEAVSMMVSDGAEIMLPRSDGTLLELAEGGQLAFGFLVNASAAKAEILERLPSPQRDHFSLENKPLLFPEPQSKSRADQVQGRTGAGRNRRRSEHVG